MQPYIYLGGLPPVPMYFIMGLSGFLFAVTIALIKRKAFGLRARAVLRIAALAIICAVIGARILNACVQIFLRGGEPGFWTAENWIQIFKNGGVLYGGLFGCVGMAALGAKLCRVDIRSTLNVLAYAMLGFASLARLGCWCAGCCYGIELASGARFPVQLFEAGYCTVALLAFLIIKPERRWPGMPLLSVNFIAYSAGRFILEFFRGDASRGVWLLSTSQWIALALIALAVVWLRKSKYKRTPQAS
ncbi:MAG: prolipoprotein diacylglyceryl transferase [Firmicutes bacterium]|nr:prolipoprotein diacylglyceryl transferase [Bacillota bacterium]